MAEPRPILHTVPTELERGDGFWDLFALAVAVLVSWWGWNNLGPRYVLLLTPVLLLLGLWVLTGEPAADVPYIGALASALRNRLGVRRLHEWAFAVCHYVRVAGWPRRVAWFRTTRAGRATARWKLRRSHQKPAPVTRQQCGVLELWPTTNHALSSVGERGDQLEAIARVLMGLSHPVQIVGRATPVTWAAGDRWHEWPKPPHLERRWFAVVTAGDRGELEWRLRTLETALDAAGLRCRLVDEPVRTVEVPLNRHWPHWIADGEEVAATLVLRRWPREVAPGWLGQALGSDLAIDVAMHIEPQDPQRVARWLRGQIGWQTANELNTSRRDAGNELGKRDAEQVRMALVARVDRPCRVGVAMTVRARDGYALDRRVATLQHELGLALADARLASFEQDRGREATEARGVCRLLGASKLLDCHSVASTGLFQPATIMHMDGADIGTTHDGSMLVRLDPFDPSLESFGGVIVAKVGMGKSYLLKLLARRLRERGVEIHIVEQRAEYDVPGAVMLNLAEVPIPERADRLRNYLKELWAGARENPRPILLILDELWSYLKDPELADLVEEIARIGRHHFVALWIATQQVRELLESGRAVLDNAAVRVYLKQHDRDLDDLCDAAGLSMPARRFLRGALRGQALMDCNGLLVAVDIQASPSEHAEISTDPREARNYGHAALAGMGVGAPVRTALANARGPAGRWAGVGDGFDRPRHSADQ